MQAGGLHPRCLQGCLRGWRSYSGSPAATQGSPFAAVLKLPTAVQAVVGSAPIAASTQAVMQGIVERQGELMRRTRFDWRLGVRFISMLALVFVVFAHRPLDAGGSTLPEASAYAFPDGSVPVICVTLAGEKGGADQHAAHALPCDACLIAGSILVPTPVDIAAHQPRPAERLVLATSEPVLVRPAFPPSAPPQAPPSA